MLSVDPFLSQRLIQQYLPLYDCRQLGVLPLRLQGDRLVLGTCNPAMPGLGDRLAFHLLPHGLTAEFEKISLQQLDDGLQAAARARSQDLLQQTHSTEDLLQEFKLTKTLDLQPLEPEPAPAEPIDSDTPLEKLLSVMLTAAIESHCSDIHIEPQLRSLRVRFRRDGVLFTVYELPPDHGPRLATRLKQMARLDPEVRNRPQDGAIRRQLEGRLLDLRLSSLPGRHGEKLVLRILSTRRTGLELEQIFPNPEQRQSLRNTLDAQGLLICCGPTGSGKTTTLYSLLNEWNGDHLNVVTVEDPPEYSLPGIHQVEPGREDSEFDYARALRAMLRQDPDVILVGEIRDRETAEAALEASLTGQRVLASLHSPDCIGALIRLRDLGIPPYLMAAGLGGVASQRLVRQVCQHCAQWVALEGSLCDRLGLSSRHRYPQVKPRPPRLEFLAVSQPDQCSECQGMGYLGRLPVLEVLPMEEELKQLLIENASEPQLRQWLRQRGHENLQRAGLNLLQDGLTTLEELLRTGILRARELQQPLPRRWAGLNRQAGRA